jgi:alkaline phosphatase
MIGDGMSTPQVYAAMLTSENPTSFERFPITGLVKTYSKSHKITDSAAGGTAIATGHKTNNGMIGMNSDSIPVPSVLETLSEKGMKTGVVATSYITHATPASFVAKNINRNNYEEIAMDFAKTDKVNILIGGGKKHFTERKDGINLIDKMVSEGWSYYDTLINTNQNDKIMILASDDHLPSYPTRGDFLPEASIMAINALNRSENGFFLMIEGSQIDFAAHNSDSTYLINEMHDFDNTINKVLDFAEKDGNTLVIVTADHETGGLTMIDPNGRYTETCFKFSTGSHSPLLVPLFAFGPGADKFSGIIENTDIIKIILNIME